MQGQKGGVVWLLVMELLATTMGQSTLAQAGRMHAAHRPPIQLPAFLNSLPARAARLCTMPPAGCLRKPAAAGFPGPARAGIAPGSGSYGVSGARPSGARPFVQTRWVRVQNSEGPHAQRACSHARILPSAGPTCLSRTAAVGPQADATVAVARDERE